MQSIEFYFENRLLDWKDFKNNFIKELSNNSAKISAYLQLKNLEENLNQMNNIFTKITSCRKEVVCAEPGRMMLEYMEKMHQIRKNWRYSSYG